MSASVALLPIETTLMSLTPQEGVGEPPRWWGAEPTTTPTLPTLGGVVPLNVRGSIGIGPEDDVT